MRVIGIDPGSRTTGWAVVDRVGARTVPIASGVVRTDPDEPMPSRLRAIHLGLTAVIALHRPTAAAMEEIFAYRSAASALVLGQARGVALLAVAGLPLSTYNNSSIKKSVTGSGKADKTQVARVVALVLGLQGKVPADETDALAIALTHLAQIPVRADARISPLVALIPKRRASTREVWAALAASVKS